MKRQTKFETEQQILLRIDETLERKKKLMAMTFDEDHVEDKIKNDKAVRRIDDATLPRLKRTLAAFRTEPMPFVDKGVVLQ